MWFKRKCVDTSFFFYLSFSNAFIQIWIGTGLQKRRGNYSKWNRKKEKKKHHHSETTWAIWFGFPEPYTLFHLRQELPDVASTCNIEIKTNRHQMFLSKQPSRKRKPGNKDRPDIYYGCNDLIWRGERKRKPRTDSVPRSDTTTFVSWALERGKEPFGLLLTEMNPTIFEIQFEFSKNTRPHIQSNPTTVIIFLFFL